MAQKRRSAQNNTPKNKKVKYEPERSEVDLKIDELVTALKNEEYTISGNATNRTMLVKVIETSMKTLRDDRHIWQHKMIGCVAEALVDIRMGLDQSVVDIQTLLDTNAMTTQELENLRRVAQENLLVKEQSLSDAQALQTSRVESLKESKNVKESSEEQLEELIDDLDSQKQKEEALRVAFEDHFQVLLSGNCEDPQILITPLQEVLTSMELDESLTACAPIALGKSESARGMFDKMSLKYIDEQFKAQRQGLTNQIISIEASIETQKCTVGQVTVAWEEARGLLEATKITVSECKASKTEAMQGLKASEKAIKDHVKSIASATDDMVVAKEDVASFQKIRDVFSWLEARNSDLEIFKVIQQQPDSVEAEKSIEVEDLERSQAGQVEECNQDADSPIEAPVDEMIIQEIAVI